MNLLIIGAGSHGSAVAETARACGYEKVDFIDDNRAPAIGRTADIERLAPKYDGTVVSIGNNELRKQLLERAVNPVTLIHPRAYVASSASVGVGSIILPGAVIHTNAHIGKGCIISIGALIDHDAVVGDYCHINTGAIIKAGAKVSDYTKVEAGNIIS